jgi:hypothetical protein
MTLDHLVIAATHLETGVAWLEDKLGVHLQPGGKHAFMGTHNRLLRLGDAYLEVITVDPDASAPPRARWFGLDHFDDPQPRLIHWVARTDNLEQAVSTSLEPLGEITDAARGDLRWQMTIPADGHLPGDGLVPTLIQWQGAHPVSRLKDSGCRLVSLEGMHPEPERIRAALEALGLNLPVAHGERPRLRATISSPGGLMKLE